MNDVVVIGGGGHARVVISLLKKIKDYHVLGYVAQEDNGDILGVSYLGSDQKLETIIKENPRCAAVIGVGKIDLEDKRMAIKAKLELLKFDLPAIVSPFAIINENIFLGEGVVIMDGVVIQTGARIGNCALVNTGCCVDHDCVIGDNVHLAPGVSLSGGVEIGDNSLIGTGSSVVQYKKIGKDCLIGVGSAVVDDCVSSGTYVGVPARKVKDSS